MATGDISPHWIPTARSLLVQATCKLNLNLVFILNFQSSRISTWIYKRKLKSIQSNENSCSPVSDSAREIQLTPLAAVKEEFTSIWKLNDNKEHSTETFFM